jgi:hypothetical protein
MKKASLLVICMAAFLAAACTSDNNNVSPGQLIFVQAAQREAAGNYESAYILYQQALPVLRQEGNPMLIKECRTGLKRTFRTTQDFSATEQQIRDTLAQTFTITEEQISFLLSRIAYLDMDGSRYYYSDFMDTSIHLDLSLMQQLPVVLNRNRIAYTTLEPFVNTPGPASGSPFINPIHYTAVATYDVPRNLLPAAGILKIWQPVPIITDYQTEVAMISVTPAAYVVNPATLNGNLGNIYLEVPLADLTGNLQIEIRFEFTHYEQRYTMIDPDNAGSYDTSSALYQEFTASRKNILITPEIADRARQIVGAEQNPYRAARMIYDHIVDNLTYSHMPYGAIESLNIPVSVYVHEQGYGDCGAQSIYFAALCASLGIPARAAGGYQLFPGMEGAHFWAEFYLPNYGWIPVDTSVAQIANYLPELTPLQKQAYKDYLFGSMDPYRWVIQKDVDLPFSPPSTEITGIALTLQLPAALCDEMDGFPEEVLWSNYQIQFTSVP